MKSLILVTPLAGLVISYLSLIRYPRLIPTHTLFSFFNDLQRLVSIRLKNIFLDNFLANLISLKNFCAIFLLFI